MKQFKRKTIKLLTLKLIQFAAVTFVFALLVVSLVKSQDAYKIITFLTPALIVFIIDLAVFFDVLNAFRILFLYKKAQEKIESYLSRKIGNEEQLNRTYRSIYQFRSSYFKYLYQEIYYYLQHGDEIN